MLRLKLEAVVAAAALGVLLGAGFSAVLDRAPLGTTQHAAGSLKSNKSLAHVPSCSEFHIPLYGVAQMAGGGSAITSSRGLAVGTVHMLSRTATPTVLTSATMSDGTTRVSEAALLAAPGVEKAGLAYAQSADPKLRSCDYRLSDRPADQALLSAAKSALEAAGIATAEHLAGDGDIYLVSDDPLDPSKVIVTVNIPTAATTTAGGPQTHGAFRVFALVDRSARSVSQVGEVPIT